MINYLDYTALNKTIHLHTPSNTKYPYTSPNISKHAPICYTMHLNTSPYASIRHPTPL